MEGGVPSQTFRWIEIIPLHSQREQGQKIEEKQKNIYPKIKNKRKKRWNWNVVWQILPKLMFWHESLIASYRMILFIWCHGDTTTLYYTYKQLPTLYSIYSYMEQQDSLYFVFMQALTLMVQIYKVHPVLSVSCTCAWLAHSAEKLSKKSALVIWYILF